MKINPRDYQKEAHDVTIAFLKSSIDPCCIELPTGAGKSIVVAMIASTLSSISGKKVLCLQPSKELLEQNYEKYVATGAKASMYSASVGKKSTRHDVIFATPQTVARSLSAFNQGYAAIIIDECHKMQDMIKGIVNHMRLENSNIRVIGLTATPFTMLDGYIYKITPSGEFVPETKGKNQFFTKLTYSLNAKYLIDKGFLTKPLIVPICESYDTSGLVKTPSGKFSKKSLDAAFNGWGRKTSNIVADVVEKSKSHMSVMLFGSTVKHCEEIMASLPPDISFMITGDTDKKQRDRYIRGFKDGKYKYAVSVETLTTGLDVTSVSVIAFLRRTESASLFQQMAGRGLRLHDGKLACVILDYAENIKNLFPDYDIFNPSFNVSISGKSSGEIECECPECGIKNVFGARKNNDGYESDKHGYWIDLAGSRIETEYGPTPSHYGRRCMAMTLQKGVYKQCEYRWSSKKCPACDADNDIAARYCCSCDLELVDPNQSLVLAQQAFDAKKRDASQPQTDRLVAWAVKKSVSTTGKEMHVVSWKTEHRTFETYTIAKPSSQFQYYGLEKLMTGTKNLTEMPKTISYKRPKGQKFFEILGFNREVEDRPQ